MTWQSVGLAIRPSAIMQIRMVWLVPYQFPPVIHGLCLRHLSVECKQLLDKAGDLVEVNRMEDPSYHVADDKLA